MTTNRMGLEQTLSDADLNAILTAAEEVISAIAGENEDVHRDNSTKMCALWDDLNDRHAPPEVVKAVVIELLARRKASREPVAWRRFQETPKDGGYWVFYDEFELRSGVEPLYASPPLQAVTVPDEICIRQAMVKMEAHDFCTSVNSGYKNGWNDCVAAMLKSVTNEP